MGGCPTATITISLVWFVHKQAEPEPEFLPLVVEGNRVLVWQVHKRKNIGDGVLCNRPRIIGVRLQSGVLHCERRRLDWRSWPAIHVRSSRHKSSPYTTWSHHTAYG